MSNILERYYQLILKDRKYCEEYIENKPTENKVYAFMKKQIEETFLWRKVKSYEELKRIIHSKDALDLLRFGDYYSDEMCELLEQYLKIDFQKLDIDTLGNILSESNLQRMVKGKDTPKQLKDCIILEGEYQEIHKEMYEYIMQNREKGDKETKLDFGELKKCAIFIHYSINDANRIEAKKNRLIKFCQDVLKTSNYEIFIEIGSFLKDRKVFCDMLKRFEDGEFSHLVVTDVGQIYKLSYDWKKALALTDKIQMLNVTIICADEGKVIKEKNRLLKEFEKLEDMETM